MTNSTPDGDKAEPQADNQSLPAKASLWLREKLATVGDDKTLQVDLSADKTQPCKDVG